MDIDAPQTMHSLEMDRALATPIPQARPRHREYRHAASKGSAKPPGCTNRRNVTPDAKRRLAHKRYFFAIMSQITEVNSPDTYRTGIMSAYISSYFPTQLQNSCRNPFNVWHWMAPRSPAMDAARDALFLAELGRRTKQGGLLLECRRRHAQAVHLLRKEMAKPGALEKDAVLCAAYHIGQCEVWNSTASSGHTWGTHVDGVSLFVLARGPDAMASPMANTLLQFIRTICVMDCLLERKKSFLAEPQWMEVFDDSSPGMELISIAVQIGTVLEQSDHLRSMLKAKEYDIVELLTDMTGLLRQLQDWLLNAYRNSPDASSPHRLVSVSKFPEFTARFGELASVFPTVMEFSSYLSASSHACVWMFMLLLREAIHGVARQHAYPLVRAANQDAVLIAEIDETAANLCQCVPYLLSEQHGTIGVMSSTGPLHFALNWFKQRHDPPRAAWCEHAIASNQQGEVLGGVYDTSLNLARPMMCWWMLPHTADFAIEGV